MLIYGMVAIEHLIILNRVISTNYANFTNRKKEKIENDSKQNAIPIFYCSSNS